MHDKSNSDFDLHFEELVEQDTRRSFIHLGGAMGLASRLVSDPSATGTKPPEVYDVRNFGAVGNGSKLETGAIQSAIDQCAVAGGGTVYFPSGTYLSGMIVLKDCVTLFLAPRSVLLGSKNIDDYPQQQSDFPEGSIPQKRAFIFAKKAARIGIEGNGTIDGQGASFDRKRSRPKMVYLEGCRNVVMRDVTLRNSAVYQSHFVSCDNLTVRGITIEGFANWNSDGIDIDGCQNVLVSDCNVACSDDAICLKSGMLRPCKNVAIANCIIRTRWGAIKFGTASQGGFENVSISNCAIYDTWGCGIKLCLVNGGRVDNVTISNITMDNVTGPIFLRLGDRGSKFGHERGLPPGVFRNVLISNIRARVAKTVRRDVDQSNEPTPAERIGSIIAGIPGHMIENVMLANIHITYPGGGTLEEARRRDIPEQEKAYPEYRIFGPTPAYGFYVRHAKGITFDNVRLELDGADERPALLCDDVSDLEISGFKAHGSARGEPLFVLRETRDAYIHGCRPLGKTGAFLRVEGGGCRGIAVTGNELSRTQIAVEAADGADRKAVREAGN